MAEAMPAELGPVLAELRWNQGAMRRARALMVVHCGLWGTISLGTALLGPGAWRLLSVVWAVNFAAYLHAARRLFAFSMPRRLAVLDAGLWLETERGERLIGWDRVEGFTGVARHTPSLAAPRTTTGGVSTSPRLWAGGESVPLEGPTRGDLSSVVALIEQRLFARQGRA
jgi:hypothetical protein